MGRTIKLTNETYLVNDLYSLSERIIGKYINNKPVYRKNINFVTQQGINKIASIQDLDDLINLYGEYTDGYNKMPSFFVLGANVLSIWISQSDIYCQCEGYVGYTGKIVIEYTKTTD